MDNFSSESEMSLLFSRRRDNDFEGLHAPEIITEEGHDHAATASEIQRENIFDTAVQEDELFDQDLGDSSDSD